MEDLYRSYAGDQSGHGDDHLSGPVVSGLAAVERAQLPGSRAVLAFNTTISFITNTNWQAYSGESTLSNFSQMGAITFPMFTSAATGFVVAMAWIRAFTVLNGGPILATSIGIRSVHDPRSAADLFARRLFMISQGAVQTLDASLTAHTCKGRSDDRRWSGRLTRHNRTRRHQRWRLLQCRTPRIRSRTRRRSPMSSCIVLMARRRPRSLSPSAR